jgi:hypothetical protein
MISFEIVYLLLESFKFIETVTFFTSSSQALKSNPGQNTDCPDWDFHALSVASWEC